MRREARRKRFRRTANVSAAPRGGFYIQSTERIPFVCFVYFVVSKTGSHPCHSIRRGRLIQPASFLPVYMLQAIEPREMPDVSSCKCRIKLDGCCRDKDIGIVDTRALSLQLGLKSPKQAHDT